MSAQAVSGCEQFSTTLDELAVACVGAHRRTLAGLAQTHLDGEKRRPVPYKRVAR